MFIFIVRRVKLPSCGLRSVDRFSPQARNAGFGQISRLIYFYLPALRYLLCWILTSIFSFGLKRLFMTVLASEPHAAALPTIASYSTGCFYFALENS